MDYSTNFGSLTFNKKAMKNYMQKNTYKKMLKILEGENAMDSKTANEVAEAMKTWAIENECTHYCHWFQPLTGSTAEKHDSFYDPDNNENLITNFSGKLLVRGEPDASSFPSGGIRDTYEARGYTAWDTSSPAFINRNETGATLCIPTAFVSWTGEALDKKTPLLRSINAVNIQAMRMLKIFGNDKGVKKTITTLGCEQEFFLIDESFVEEREDLLLCGTTLIGKEAPKGHQLDDHYFGTMKERVLAYYHDVEYQLLDLGVPFKTRHNEVAPAQFELAPTFENANVATDHQMITMHVLKKTAKDHGFCCLLHEKPFARINGSGKHNNWSISTDTGLNLLDPTEKTHENIQFLTFLCSIIQAVDKHADLLRASIASAGNDLRLGGNEAPPAIISIFLGEMLTDILEQIEKGKVSSTKKGGIMNLGSTTIAEISRHSGDRNRTSPFAFTGNKFEFRAPGSACSIAWPNTVLNTIIAESIDEIATKIELEMKSLNLEKAVYKVLKEVITKHKKVCFDGDGYSQNWEKEAIGRGLPNLKTCADALPCLKSKKALDVFEKYDVLTNVELKARVEILEEQYVTNKEIEARTLISMMSTQIIPAAEVYQFELAKNLNTVSSALASKNKTKIQQAKLNNLTNIIEESLDLVQRLIQQEKKHLSPSDIKNSIIPLMDKIRSCSDELEGIIPDDLWPIPKYSEILFLF
ncbi:glutamine synthetase type III [bacterium]|nr:glutamine synthetase type III [bacterium]|tara:strand:- start:14696 stop:16789 length:2094 start_codon:yes stop_codon:yes gene_type:complete